jgi:hypothetical protein
MKGSAGCEGLRSALTVHKAAHYVCLAQFAERTSTQTNLALVEGYHPQRKHRRRVAGIRQPPTSRPPQVDGKGIRNPAIVVSDVRAVRLVQHFASTAEPRLLVASSIAVLGSCVDMLTAARI